MYLDSKFRERMFDSYPKCYEIIINTPLAQMYRANRYERLGQGLESLMEYYSGMSERSKEEVLKTFER